MEETVCWDVALETSRLHEPQLSELGSIKLASAIVTLEAMDPSYLHVEEDSIILRVCRA